MGYAVDAKHVYWCGLRLEGADRGTFQILEEPHSIDANQFFVGITPLKVHSFESFEVWKVHSYDYPTEHQGQDPNENLARRWSREGIAYYWRRKELKGAGYNSVVSLNRLHAKDNKTVYCEGE